VDASFFPSSAAVNPSLTIIAQALRVADTSGRWSGERMLSIANCQLLTAIHWAMADWDNGIRIQ
jgi:hypothetical protein